MLSIRMQRLGRKGHPTYRIVVQDSRYAPTSGKYVALLGSYDPHTKQATLQKDKASLYLKNGAQPSDRVVKIFTDQKVSLPKWVKKPIKQTRDIKNPDKLRKNRPAQPAPEPAVEPKEDVVSESPEPKVDAESDIEVATNNETVDATEKAEAKTGNEIEDVANPTEESQVEKEETENTAGKDSEKA